MLVSLPSKNKEFKYFFQRFENGRCIAPHLPRITTEESVKQFKEREEGLRVLLINPSIRSFAYPNIENLGYAYIASSAIVDGHKIKILDLNGERKKPVEDEQEYKIYSFNRIKEELESFNPNVIGIGGIITQYKDIKEITNFIKKNIPEIPIILGCGIATCMPIFMLKRLQIDIVSIEEGDLTFSEILYRIENKISLNGCKGTLFKDENGNIFDNGKREAVEDGEFGLDCLNWPSRHLLDIENVYKVNPVGHLNIKKWNNGEIDTSILGKFSLSILGSRGCPYSCNYCAKAVLQDGYNRRSPKDIVDEMEYLTKRYNLSYIHFLDDLYLTNWKWSLDFFKELNERKINNNFDIEFGATCRANIIADDIERAKKQNRKHMMELAFEAGARQICLGIESASNIILKEIKRIFGYTDPSLMLGNPKETKETIIETINVIKEVNADTETIFYCTAFPNTKFWQLALEKGLIGKAVKGYKCAADEDIIEEYFMLLGENSEKVRTNFSDELSDEELEEMGAWATQELLSLNKRHPKFLKEPHTGDLRIKGAVQASL